MKMVMKESSPVSFSFLICKHSGCGLVVEVKREAGAPMSEMERTLHEMHIQSQRMSKYCIGTALTDPTAKRNRFKPSLLYIDNLLTY